IKSYLTLPKPKYALDAFASNAYYHIHQRNTARWRSLKTMIASCALAVRTVTLIKRQPSQKVSGLKQSMIVPITKADCLEEIWQ
ncbi:hypothetical protein Q4S27_22775, partial [Morganella morganii subsp. sibonii]